MLHHIDIHVRDLAAASALLDGVAQSVGYRRREADAEFVGYERSDGGRPRFGLILDPDGKAGSTRIAFAVPTPEAVDGAAAAARASGARVIEGPGCHPEYGEYYAVFFEDADGNKYEIVADAVAVRLR